jgi:hypothetical protein
MEVQVGGVKKGLLEFLDKSRPTQALFLYILFTLMIVFKEQLPVGIYTQLDSFPGRLLILFSLVTCVQLYGWIVGLIAAIAFALLLGLPNPITEGFGSGGETSIKVIPTEKKWFVEKVFGENPIAIEEEKVVTEAVQNDSPGALTGGVQNTSVQ